MSSKSTEVDEIDLKMLKLTFSKAQKLTPRNQALHQMSKRAESLIQLLKKYEHNACLCRKIKAFKIWNNSCYNATRINSIVIIQKYMKRLIACRKVREKMSMKSNENDLANELERIFGKIQQKISHSIKFHLLLTFINSSNDKVNFLILIKIETTNNGSYEKPRKNRKEI